MPSPSKPSSPRLGLIRLCGAPQITFMGNDSLAQIAPADLARRSPNFRPPREPSVRPTARRLVDASAPAPITRRAYAGALGRLDAWLWCRSLRSMTSAATRPAAYVAELHDAPSAGSRLARAAPRWRSTTPAAPPRRRDGGRRGAVPQTRRGAESRRRGYCQSPRRLPPDRRRPRPRPGAPVQRRGPGGRARHVPPAAPARARRRVRPGGRPRAAVWTP